MDLIGSELRSLLQKENDNEEESCFDNSTVIQELVLPMLERWTTAISFNQQNSLRTWSDLFSVLDALPSTALKLCICTAEYLLDIILQHVQIDVYETEIGIWSLASRCFLLLLENCGVTVWRETNSNSNDFTDNLLDIYQSTETSWGKECRSASSFESHSHTLLLLEIMITMVLNSPEPAALQSFTSQVAHCISNLMSHFQLNYDDMRIENKKIVDLTEVSHDGSKIKREVLENFNEIVSNYLTETTKKCRLLLLTNKTEEVMDEYDLLYEEHSDDVVFIKNQSDVEYLQTKKTSTTNSFSILQEILSLICNHDQLFHYPDIMNHIISCHSCLCIVPQLEETASDNIASNHSKSSLSFQLSELHVIITNLLIRICNSTVAVNVSNMLSYLPGISMKLNFL
jgi:hypothetical protein